MSKTSTRRAREASEKSWQCAKCLRRHRSEADLADHVRKVHERLRRPRKPVLCPYCGSEAKLLGSSAPLYRGTDYGPVWLCSPCGAWVGCHPGSALPLGRLADASLRQAKMAAHAAFDPLWRRKMERDGLGKGHARSRAYQWLAGQLGVEREACHIACSTSRSASGWSRSARLTVASRRLW